MDHVLKNFLAVNKLEQSNENKAGWIKIVIIPPPLLEKGRSWPFI